TEFREVLAEKFNILRPLAQRLRAPAPSNFVHIAHYGYQADLLREHAFLKRFPADRFDQWCRGSFPTVFEVNFRGFAGGAPAIRGWIIVINNSTQQLLDSNKLRRAKIVQCARLAEALGAHVVGMAGLIAFFGKGGHFLSDLFPQLGLTTGHAYTIANILEVAKSSAQRAGLPLTEATVAV